MDVVFSVLKALDFETTTFWCQVGLFFVLHFSLNFLVYQPIMDARNARDAKIAVKLAAAEEATEVARKLKEEYEEKVRVARLGGQAGLAEVTEKAEAERKERVDKAREKAGKILADAQAEAEAAREKAAATVKKQSEEVAQAIARRLISSSLDAKDSKPLLAKVGGGK